ncbi:hypothetical protein BDF19DRAFT_498070 [Syncephalis fuscata]|nr:hypothetical protein BDF19DRAFT_498070 [Syncephalis fuscata]
MSFLEPYQALTILITLLAYITLTTIVAIVIHIYWQQKPPVLRLRSIAFASIPAVTGALLVAAQLVREYMPRQFPCTAIYWSYSVIAPAWLLGLVISVLRMCWLMRDEAVKREADEAINGMRMNTGKQFLDWMHKWDAPDIEEDIIEIDPETCTIAEETVPEPPEPPAPSPSAGNANVKTVTLLTGNTIVSQGPSRSILSRMVDSRQLWLDSDAPQSASRVTSDHLVQADWSFQRSHWFTKHYLFRLWLYAALAHFCPAFGIQIITRRYSVFPVVYGNCSGGTELAPFFVFGMFYFLIAIIVTWRLAYGNASSGSDMTNAAIRAHMPKFIHWEVTTLSLALAFCLGGFAIGFLWDGPPFSPDLFLTVAVVAVHTIHLVIPTIFAITTGKHSIASTSSKECGSPSANNARASMATITF